MTHQTPPCPIFYPQTRETGVCLLHHRDRVRALQRGLMQGARAQVTVRRNGISLAGQNVPEDTMQAALLSAEATQRRTQKANRIKRWVLKAQYNWSRRLLRKHTPCFALCWNGIKGHRYLFMQAARDLGMATVFMEESPIPGRVTVDFRGVNYGNSLPRSAAVYQAWQGQNGVAAGAWRDVMKTMQARKAATRDDVGQNAAGDALIGEKYLFCPLQVPGDSQITIYGDWVKSIEHLIETLGQVAQALPDGWHIRVKEHPTARTSFGDRLRAMETDKFRLDNDTDTFAQVAASQGVITVNSSVGLQSFAYDKPVLVLGQAFYAFDGVATKVSSADHLRQILHNPTEMTFDPAQRDAFMNYLVTEYFPKEEDCKAGRYTVFDAVTRDQRLMETIALLG